MTLKINYTYVSNKYALLCIFKEIKSYNSYKITLRRNIIEREKFSVNSA